MGETVRTTYADANADAAANMTRRLACGYVKGGVGFQSQTEVLDARTGEKSEEGEIFGETLANGARKHQGAAVGGEASRLGRVRMPVNTGRKT